jgi:hypothetical protein
MCLESIWGSISPEDGPGSHPGFCPHPVDRCRIPEAWDGCIRLITLAPETEGAIPFIERYQATW